MAHDTRVMFGQCRKGDDVDCGYKDAGAARIFKAQNDANQNFGQYQTEYLCCKSKLRFAKACCGVYEKQDVRSILITFWNMNYATFHYLWQT